MESKHLGKLHKEEDEWLPEGRVPLPIFDSFKTEIIVDEDVTLEILEPEIEPLFSFKEDLKTKLGDIMFAAWEEYKEIVGALDVIDVFEAIPEGEREKWQQDSLDKALKLKELTKKEQIWDFVKPDSAFIYEEEGACIIELHFKTEWNNEHGVMVNISQSGEKVEAG